MLIQLTQDCQITGVTMAGHTETRVYERGEILDCLVYFDEYNDNPNISDNYDGFIMYDVDPELYEVSGEELKIKFNSELEFDADGDIAPEDCTEFKRIYSVDETVNCLVFGYFDCDKMVDIEFEDGAVFNKVDTGIYQVIE